MAAGMGMKNSNDKTSKKGGSGGKGMGKNKDSSSSSTKKSGESNKASYDVAKAWLKSKKLYDELLSESNKVSFTVDEDGGLDTTNVEGEAEDITTEYIIAARCRLPETSGGNNSNTNNNAALRSASDWIPVAQLCILRPIQPEESGANHDEVRHALPLRAAVSCYCREIYFAATLATPALKSLPRNNVEYSYEPVDSWIRHVYEDVIEGKVSDSYVDSTTGIKVDMTKSKAREVLGLEAGCTDASLIKRAYKKESMACHPDRFVTSAMNNGVSKEEVEEYTKRFGLVKMAYDALNSGIRDEQNNNMAAAVDTTIIGGQRSSWYESLGGKQRTDFVGPIDLMSMDEANLLCNKAFRSAVIGLDPDLTNAFVLRNQAAATVAAAATVRL
jgi:hypothetical protein